MNRFKSKITALLLTVFIVVASSPALTLLAYAVAGGKCGDNVTWKLDLDGTMTFSGSGDMRDYPDWDNYQPSITGVVFEGDITSISEYAFYESELTSITIPEGITAIGQYTFYCCYELTNITLPASLTSIGPYAFTGCYNLKDIYYCGSREQFARISIAEPNCVLFSDNVTVHYNVTPLKITTQPSDYTGNVGSTATFKVAANAKSLKYQWQTYSSGRWVDSSLSGAQTATLSVPVTVARNGYMFRCVVTDSINQTVISDDATLKVNKSQLSITSHPADYTGNVGSTAIFKVKAKGEGLKYQWQSCKNGIWSNSSLTGAKTATLSVPVTYSRDGYRFRCVVTDSFKQSVKSNDATLTVNATPLAITSQPKSYTGDIGTTAKFTVKAQGPGLKYQWQAYINGKWVNSSLTGAKTATLSVPVTQARNNYYFRCIITDATNKTVTSDIVALWVATVPLSITTQPKNYTGAVGSTATFKVTAQGTGLKYQWQVYSNGKWVNSSLTGAKTTTLTVPVTKARNGYTFRCVITDSNKKTITSNSASITVK